MFVIDARCCLINCKVSRESYALGLPKQGEGRSAWDIFKTNLTVSWSKTLDICVILKLIYKLLFILTTLMFFVSFLNLIIQTSYEMVRFRLSDISQKLIIWPEEDIPIILKIETNFLPRCHFLLKSRFTDNRNCLGLSKSGLGCM